MPLAFGERNITTLVIFLGLIVCVLIGDYNNKHAVEPVPESKEQFFPSNTNESPTFVLHVGPPKTGTTAVQFTMQSPDIKALLGKDHYSFVPNEITHRRDLVGKLDSLFLEKVEEFRVLGNNVFASSEYLMSLKKAQCRHWKDVFVTEQNFRLEIVMVHRHWHQQLPSLWNQHYKFKRVNRIPTSRHQDWPGINHDTRIPTIEEMWDENNSTIKQQMKQNYVSRVFDCWQDIAHKVTVFDMHEPWLMLGDGRVVDAYPDMVRNFICHALPGANHTCDDYNLHAIPRKNKSENLDYDILAVYAYENGLITDKSLRRKVVVRKTSRHAVSNNITLPLKCPSKEVIDDIYSYSLYVEKWAKSPVQFSKGNEAELSPDQLAEFNIDWEATVAKNKLCTTHIV